MRLIKKRIQGLDKNKIAQWLIQGGLSWVAAMSLMGLRLSLSQQEGFHVSTRPRHPLHPEHKPHPKRNFT